VNEPRPGRHLALATWSLFAGLALLMLAGGLFGTMLGIRSELVGLPTAVSSLISASYYIGFLIGSRLTLAGLGRVGHIRVYSALASTLAAAMIAVGITHNAPSWALLRLATGVCTAGLYVVAESWLNDLATNENRGRLMAVYSVVTIAFFGAGQVMVSGFDSRLVTGYALAAIITSLAVAPVSLSEAAVAPSLEETEHISLRELAKVVPTGVGSVLLIGVTHGAMAGMIAVYATRVDLSVGRIGLFVALLSVGGVLLQWPIASASDDLDRRPSGLPRQVPPGCRRCCCSARPTM
jgi:MFS family permease